MTTFPIAIDATQLFYRFFIIPGVTPDFISSRTVQTLELAPGDYSFQVQSGVFTDLSFTVTFQGTLDYDHSCDTFLSGRGTSSLQLIGLEVTLDASSLSGASGGGGVLLASSALTNDDWIQRRTVRLLPQSTFWVQQGSGLIAQLAFGLQRDGRFSYAPELDATQGGPLMGAGTNTLTFKGHTVLVDASTVSRFLMVHPILAVEPAQDGKTSIVVLPADGFRLQLDQGVTDLGFSVGITGAVTLNPEMRDWLGIFPGSVGVPPTVRVLHHPAPEQADPAATSRFCGVPDTPPQMLGTRPLSYGSPIGRWTRGNLTINVNKTDSKGVDADVIDNIVLSVYRQYELQQPFFFSFTKKDDPDSDIRVQFGGRDGIPPRGGLGGPDGRLWISAQNIWTPRSLLQILLHEAGHTLGLSHSTLSTSVMYPFYTEDTLVKKIDPVTGRPTTPKIDDKTIFDPANPVTRGTISPSVRNTILDPETIEAIKNLYGWRAQVPLADRASTDGPSFAVVREFLLFGTGTETLFMAWKGSEGDSGLYFASSGDGIQWSAPQQIDGIGSSHGPALTTWSGPPPEPDGTPLVGLFMVWKGTHDDHNIYWAMNPNPIRQPWTDQQPIDVGTSARPALVEFNGQMILAWKGIPGDQRIYWSKFDWATHSWSPQKEIGGRRTSHGPALVVFKGQLHMFWKGSSDDINAYHAILVDPDGGIWGPQEMVVWVDAGNLDAGETPIPIATSDPLSATVRGDELVLAWKGSPGDHALWFSRFSDGSFSGQISVPDVGSEAGPGIATLNGRLVLGWRGIDSDHTLWVSTLG